MELLRIYATFLVLVVHATFFSTGDPSIEDFDYNPLPAFTKAAFESISIVAVNVFILISGWFGIKVSVKGLFNFLFQCAFFLVGTYIAVLATGHASLSIHGIADCLCLTHWNWFIKSYIALYILSPALNLFAEKSSRRDLGLTLIGFYTFQTIWGWTGAASFIDGGYSAFSFIGLYLLARYMKKYGVGKLADRGGYIYILICRHLPLLSGAARRCLP